MEILRGETFWLSRCLSKQEETLQLSIKIHPLSSTLLKSVRPIVCCSWEKKELLNFMIFHHDYLQNHKGRTASYLWIQNLADELKKKKSIILEQTLNCNAWNLNTRNLRKKLKAVLSIWNFFQIAFSMSPFLPKDVNYISQELSVQSIGSQRLYICFLRFFHIWLHDFYFLVDNLHASRIACIFLRS